MTHLNDEEGKKAPENGDFAPKSNGGHISEAPQTPSEGNSHPREPRNRKRRTDMTLEELYNGFKSDEEEEDIDWDPVLPAGDDDDFDFDEEDYSAPPVTKWFCVNCTVGNADGYTHCYLCGEHRNSGIVKHGFQASPSTEAFDDNVAGGIKDPHLQYNVSDKPTAIGFDERMLLHEEGEMKPHPHPERPDRVRAIAASLATAGIFPGRCSSVPAREITREELQMVHALENIDAVEHTRHYLSSYFTPDTYANKYSACAARLAAGLCFDLATTICSGSARNGFALVRPPGHHAGVKDAMGFCLHNNAAIAALAAQRAGAKKILIVDWDVHHGNGTQEIFNNSKSVLYVSLHRHEGGDFYPGTGAANEVGTMGAEGYCVNIPWSTAGVGDNDYIFAFKHVVLPIASEFKPDFTIISAGFDAARGDPLGCCDVTPSGYAQMAKMCHDLSNGKLLVILEGGYNLRSISSSATAVIKVLLGDNLEHSVEHEIPSVAGLQTVFDVHKIQMNYWSSMRSNMLKFHSEWAKSLRLYAPQNKKKQKTQKQAQAPIWWKWGRKRWLYRVFNRKLSHQL